MPQAADPSITHALILSGGGGRGAFQAGALKAIDKSGWKPNMVVGNSIGATNGAIYLAPQGGGSGSKRLEKLWLKSMKNPKMHQASEEWPWAMTKIIALTIAFLQKITTPSPRPESEEAIQLLQDLVHTLQEELNTLSDSWLSVDTLVEGLLGQRSLMTRDQWRKLLEANVDTGHLNEASTPCFGVATTDVLTGAPRIFWNHDPKKPDGPEHLDIEHVMASSSIPAIYPATPIDSRMYWDGVLVANVPIGPALDAGATDIVVVMMTPWHAEPTGKGVELKSQEPNLLEGLSRFLDWIMLSAFRAELKRAKKKQRVRIIAPKELSSPIQIVDYDPEDSKVLFDQGYEAAKETMNG